MGKFNYKKLSWWATILISIGVFGGAFLIPISIDEQDKNINTNLSNASTEYTKRALVQFYGALSSVKIIDSEMLWSGETNDGNTAYVIRANYKIRLANSKALAVLKCSYALFYVKDEKVISLSSRKAPLPACFKRGSKEDDFIKKFINDGVIESGN